MTREAEVLLTESSVPRDEILEADEEPDLRV